MTLKDNIEDVLFSLAKVLQCWLRYMFYCTLMMFFCFMTLKDNSLGHGAKKTSLSLRKTCTAELSFPHRQLSVPATGRPCDGTNSIGVISSK